MSAEHQQTCSLYQIVAWKVMVAAFVGGGCSSMGPRRSRRCLKPVYNSRLPRFQLPDPPTDGEFYEQAGSEQGSVRNHIGQTADQEGDYEVHVERPCWAVRLLPKRVQACRMRFLILHQETKSSAI